MRLLLFVTANISPETIDHFLTASANNSEWSFNLFILASSPEQTSLQRYATEPPVGKTPDGFFEYGDEQLPSMVVKLRKLDSQSCESICFVSMDADSEKHKAVNFFYRCHPGKFNAHTKTHKDPDEWFKFRIPFNKPWSLYNSFRSVPYSFDELVENIDKFVDGNGVLDVGSFEKFYYGADFEQDD